MNLYNRLNEIEKSHKLNKYLKLQVHCIDGDLVEGFF